MTKEVLLDKLSANKIVFRVNPEAQGYQQILVEDGVLVIQCQAEKFWTNCGEIANFNFDKLF
jgi:hypothetical protein